MDTEYILGCSLELAETTALEYTVLNSRMGAYWKIRSLVDSNADLPDRYLENTAGESLAQMAPSLRQAMALKSLGCLEFSLQAWTEWLEHNVQVKAQSDLGVRPFPTGRLALPAPLEGQRLVRSEADINENLVRQVLDELAEPMGFRVKRDLGLIGEAIAQTSGVDARLLVHQLREDLLTQDAIGLSEVAAKVLAAAQRKEAAAQREKHSIAKAAIKKATRLFENLGQRNNLQLFVSGQQVELQHPKSPFKFILRPLRSSGWLLDRTQEGRSHTPYELSLLTKDEVFLANLCVYFDRTPVLDQLLALSLFIQAGDEVKVLEKANWFGLQDWSPEKTKLVEATYPQLLKKLPRPAGHTPDESRHRVIPVSLREHDLWRPYEAPVRQWVKTWLEPVTRAARPLLAAAPAVHDLLELAKDPLRVNRTDLRVLARAG